MGPTVEILSYLAALAAALAGSLHCAGMCGPLRLLCADAAGARWKYQAGRGLAYSMLGAFAGGVGFVLPLWALLLLFALGIAGTLLPLPVFPGWIRLRQQLLKVGSTSPFFLGLTSGLLPCGLLHAWLAAAAAAGTPLKGAIILAMLWLGSLPALEAFPLFAKRPLAELTRRFPFALRLGLILLVILPIVARQNRAEAQAAANKQPSGFEYRCH